MEGVNSIDDLGALETQGPLNIQLFMNNILFFNFLGQKLCTYSFERSLKDEKYFFLETK